MWRQGKEKDDLNWQGGTEEKALALSLVSLTGEEERE